MGFGISEVNIACDAALYLGEGKRLDFFRYEEERDKLEREYYGVCENCNGSGFLKDNNE